MAKIGVTETRLKRDNLIAGEFPRKQVSVTLEMGQNLLRGTVLGKLFASEKYCPLQCKRIRWNKFSARHPDD